MKTTYFIFSIIMLISVNIHGQKDTGSDSFYKFHYPVLDKNVRISSGFGDRIHPLLGISKIHNGIDIAVKKGTPIYATTDGIVKKADYTKSYGNRIVISHNNNLSTLYAHLMLAIVKTGEMVKSGQVIGFSGDSGLTTGDHLHYEVIFKGKRINPVALLLLVNKYKRKRIIT